MVFRGAWQWRSHGGQGAALDSEIIAKNWEKEEENEEKTGKRGKKLGKRGKIGKVFFTLPLLTDRA